MEDYGWHTEKDLGVDLKESCIKDRCGSRLCLVCLAVKQSRTIWRVMTKDVDHITERIKEGTKGLVPYDGNNEEQFVRSISKWLMSNKELRGKIAGAGFDYLNKEEMQEES